MPDTPDARWNAAQASLARGDLAAAALQFKALVLDGVRPPAALLALSLIAQRQGRFREALAAARSAAGAVQALQRWEALAQVAYRLLLLGEHRRMLDLLNAADWSHPHVLAHAAGLVQYLGLADQHAFALDRAEFALQRSPSDATLHFARGIALRHLGRIDAAHDALERCIEIDPLHAQAHWALASLRRGASPGTRIARIEHVARQTPLGSEDACLIDYALFKEYHDAGDHAAAWQALQRGALRKRATLRHSPEREDALADAIIAAFPGCTERFTDVDGADPIHRPIFIVGMPRTGTTVLERMLGRHDDVMSAGELNDLAIQLAWEADRFVQGTIDEAVLARIDAIDFAHLGRAYLERTAWRARGRPCLIDKTPANLRLVGVVLRALPQARVLCLQREPMDACFSNLKELFAGDHYAYSYAVSDLAAEYARSARLMAHWQTVAPERVLLIGYEALVRDPVAQARRVLEFCGLDWDPRCADIVANTTPSATASSVQVREPIHDRNIGAWRRYADRLAPLQALLAARGIASSP